MIKGSSSNYQTKDQILRNQAIQTWRSDYKTEPVATQNTAAMQNGFCQRRFWTFQTYLALLRTLFNESGLRKILEVSLVHDQFISIQLTTNTHSLLPPACLVFGFCYNLHRLFKLYFIWFHFVFFFIFIFFGGGGVYCLMFVISSIFVRRMIRMFAIFKPIWIYSFFIYSNILLKFL